MEHEFEIVEFEHELGHLKTCLISKNSTADTMCGIAVDSSFDQGDEEQFVQFKNSGEITCGECLAFIKGVKNQVRGNRLKKKLSAQQS